MNSNDEEGIKYLEIVIKELVVKGEAPANVLDDSNSMLRWWRNLEQTKQEEIQNQVKIISQTSTVIPDNKSQPKKKIKETKNTCKACGNVWFYGKKEETENVAASLQNAGKALTCCSGCLPALFIPDKEVIDLNKCPKCGSKAIVKEEVIHEV